MPNGLLWGLIAVLHGAAVALCGPEAAIIAIAMILVFAVALRLLGPNAEARREHSTKTAAWPSPGAG